MITIRVLVLVTAAVLFSLPSLAYAMYEPAAFPGASRNATAFLLDWTIATVERSGCLACHSDNHLVEIVGRKVVRLSIDDATLQRSAHAKLLCTDCHVGFGRHDVHPNISTTEAWKTVAKTSCARCHKKQFAEWARSYHSTSPTSPAGPGVGRLGSSAAGMPRPTCGDCHGGHAIPAKSDAAGRASLQASGMTMCGRCHKKSAASYRDYYHGSAYLQGAPDAPACWACHNSHLTLPSSDSRSSTNQASLVATCGRCHKHVGTGYVAYAKLVHAQKAAYADNPIVTTLGGAASVIGGVFGRVFAR